MDEVFARVEEVAYSLQGFPDLLPVRSDLFSIRVFSIPNFPDLILRDLVEDFVPLAPLNDFGIAAAPNHVVDFFEQHLLHLLGEVDDASPCPYFKVL